MPKPDGPCAPYTWRLDGDVIDDKMKAMAWALANLLFENRQLVEFSALAEPVFGDREALVTEDNVGTHRKNANKFFRLHGIPWRIRTKKRRYVWIERGND